MCPLPAFWRCISVYLTSEEKKEESILENRKQEAEKQKETKNEKQDAKQNNYILALNALLSRTTFGNRVYYIPVLLFYRVKQYNKSTSGHLLPFFQQQHSELAFTINIRRHLHY